MTILLRSALLAVVCAFVAQGLEAKDYYAADFGARPDGVTLNTACIQAAIDFASANGGGRVILTPGKYLCGSIYLKNDVDLHLEAGATLLGSLNPWDYVKDPYIKWTAFIFAVKQHNIALTGEGVVDCRGFEVANQMVQYIHRGLFADELKLDRPQEANRPEDIHFRECKNVTIQDVTLKNPACWTQQYELCDNLLIERIKVDAKAYWNNDGLDVVDCTNVIVRDCFIDSTDDAYCFKSHHADGLSENILVENCIGRSSANGIKFGTMTVGTFRHFVFRNMTIFDTYRSAITIASVDGGEVEDVVVDGLKSIHTGNPIFIRTGLRRGDVNRACLKDIVIKNVYAEIPVDKPDYGLDYEGPTLEDMPRNICPCAIVGLKDQNVKNVTLENVEVRFPGGGDPSYVKVGTNELDKVPEMPTAYPEFSQFKELPAWGFYIRHAEGVTFKNVVLKAEAKDYRPAVVIDDVQNSDFKGLKAIAPSLKGRLYQAKNCKNIKK